MTKNSVELGKITEYQFAADALSNNLVIFWPAAQNLPYDFIVTSGVGTPIKIQVKRAGYQRGTQYKAQTCQGSKVKTPYPKGTFDFYAIHCDGAWYLIPQDLIPHTTWTVSEKTIGKWGHYLENWKLLHEASLGN